MVRNRVVIGHRAIAPPAARRREAVGGAVVLALALAACAGSEVSGTSPTSTADASTSQPTVTNAPSALPSGEYQQIDFPSRNGSPKSGRLFGTGQVAVVLSHMGRPRDDQDDWASFAAELADGGYQVLTYDHENSEVWQDVLGAVDYLRDSGADTVIVGGASIGAMASLRAAEESGTDVDGIIWLAGVLHNSGYDFYQDDVAQVACPMLVISADRDSLGAADDARQLDGWSADSELHIIPSMSHGTDILADGGPAADQLEQAMLAFVDRIAAGSSTC